jgi:hypothetical protein
VTEGRVVSSLYRERTKPKPSGLGAALLCELFSFGEAGRKLGSSSVTKEILLGSLPQRLWGGARGRKGESLHHRAIGPAQDE